MTGKREWGSEARGGDGNDGPPGKEQKVEIENRYFDKLKERLGQQPEPATEPATAEPKKPGFVIYGNDGLPLKP